MLRRESTSKGTDIYIYIYIYIYACKSHQEPSSDQGNLYTYITLFIFFLLFFLFSSPLMSLMALIH
jgi:hypothetical protein